MQTGLVGDDGTEITSGLSEGDVVVLSAGARRHRGLHLPRWRVPRWHLGRAGRARVSRRREHAGDRPRRRHQDVRRGRGRGARASPAWTWSVERGDYVAIMGASGSGKSTLMNIIGCLDVPTRGPVPASTASTSDGSTSNQLSAIRNRKIGFVFQSFNLIPRTTALAQRRAPARLRGRDGRRTAGAGAPGARPGRPRRPQRAPAGPALRRPAAAGRDRPRDRDRPVLLLADEPTGALDSHSRRRSSTCSTSSRRPVARSCDHPRGRCRSPRANAWSGCATG